MIVGGIDPDSKGAVAKIHTVDETYDLIAVLRLDLLGSAPGGWQPVAAFLEDVDVIYVERVGPRPGEGVVSCFNFGQVNGRLIGLAEAQGKRIVVVNPQTWQVHTRGHRSEVDACVRYFPDFGWPSPRGTRSRPTKRAAAAPLIALYGAIQENMLRDT